MKAVGQLVDDDLEPQAASNDCRAGSRPSISRPPDATQAVRSGPRHGTTDEAPF